MSLKSVLTTSKRSMLRQEIPFATAREIPKAPLQSALTNGECLCHERKPWSLQRMFSFFLSVNITGVIYSWMSFEVPLCFFPLRKKPDRTPFASSSFVCWYKSKLGLLFVPLCNCALNVHWSLLWRNVTAYNSRPFQIKVNTTDTRHINSHGGIDSRIKE